MECFICLEKGNVVRSPCLCTSTVHLKCLKQAIVSSGNSNLCTVCKSELPFKVTTTSKTRLTQRGLRFCVTGIFLVANIVLIFVCFYRGIVRKKFTLEIAFPMTSFFAFVAFALTEVRLWTANRWTLCKVHTRTVVAEVEVAAEVATQVAQVAEPTVVAELAEIELPNLVS